MIGAEEGAHPGGLEAPVGLRVGEAPVVRAHGHIVEQAVDAGEIEVDDAAQAGAVEEGA